MERFSISSKVHDDGNLIGETVKLTVAICTRNRANSLRSTIQSIVKSSLHSSFSLEILVVDNGSTDETPHVVLQESAAHKDLLRYLLESRRGVSHARNAAVRASRGSYIAFADDDVIVNENWVTMIVEKFEQDNKVMVLTGRVLLAHKGLQPCGFIDLGSDKIFSSFADCMVPMGANCAIRKSLYDIVGEYDVRLGPGQYFSGGDETEFFYRVLKAGFPIHYFNELTVLHNHDRTTPHKMYALLEIYGRGFTALVVKHVWNGDRDALRLAYWTIRPLVRQALRRGANPNSARCARASLKGCLMALPAALWVMRR